MHQAIQNVIRCKTHVIRRGVATDGTGTRPLTTDGARPIFWEHGPGVRLQP